MGINSKTWSWSEELFAATTPVSPCDGARLHEYSSFLPAPDSFMLSDQREQLSNASSMASAPASVLLLPRRPTSNAGFVGIQPTRQISGGAIPLPPATRAACPPLLLTPLPSLHHPSLTWPTSRMCGRDARHGAVCLRRDGRGPQHIQRRVATGDLGRPRPARSKLGGHEHRHVTRDRAFSCMDAHG
mgnify:CR=1 FL=1